MYSVTLTGLPVEKSIRMTEDRNKWRKYVHGVAALGLRTAKEKNRTVSGRQTNKSCAFVFVVLNDCYDDDAKYRQTYLQCAAETTQLGLIMLHPHSCWPSNRISHCQGHEWGHASWPPIIRGVLGRRPHFVEPDGAKINVQTHIHIGALHLGRQQWVYPRLTRWFIITQSPFCMSGVSIVTIWWNYFDVRVRLHFYDFTVFYCTFVTYSVCLYVCLCVFVWVWAMLPDSNKMMMSYLGL